MPAFPQMHRNPTIALHVVFEQHTVFGVFLVQQHAVLRAGQTPRQFRRARVVTQLTVRVQLVQHLHVIRRHGGQVFLPPQACNALQVLAGASGLIPLKVVQANARVGIQVGKGLLFTRHQGDEAGQNNMFKDVGMVAGVEGVTIVHGCSCAGAEVYPVQPMSSGVMPLPALDGGPPQMAWGSSTSC